MTFGERLQSLRKSRNIDRKELAQILDIPYTTLRNYEKDTREPGHLFLIKVATYFEVTTDYLLGMDEIRQNLSISQDEQKSLHLYRQLNLEDKAEIRGEMKHMIKSDKYQSST